ncbi:thioredoxin-like protein, partial [Ochromonadaceae sp. CCMP2298]
LIKTNPCMVFSQSTCPFCVKAKNLLITELGATVKVVELNLDKELGYPIRAELGKRTGRTSVPSVWIGGKFVGGC